MFDTTTASDVAATQPVGTQPDTVPPASGPARPRAYRRVLAAASVQLAKLDRDLWSLWPTTLAPAFAVLAAVTTFMVLATVDSRNMPTDISGHVVFTIDGIEDGDWLPNFLFFRTVALISSNSTDDQILMIVTSVVLAFSVAAKFLMSTYIARRWMAQDVIDHVSVPNQRKLDGLLVVTLFALLWSFNLPVTGNLREFYYIGQFPSNVWHNSTTMFLMPFALGLLWTSWRYLREPSSALLAAITVLSVLNLWAKPSFFMSFIVAWPILVIIQHRLSRAMWTAAAAMLIPAAVMLLQANTLFVDNESSQSLGGVEWAPFDVWSAYSKNLLLSLAVSLAFPLTVVAFYARTAFSSLFFRYVALNLLAALAIYSFLSESGIRKYDANFSWQVVVATYLIFLASVMVMFRVWIRRAGVIRYYDWIIIGAFSLHVASGFIYLSRWFATNLNL